MPARLSVTAGSPPPEPWLPARRVLGAEGFANVAVPADGDRLGAELLARAAARPGGRVLAARPPCAPAQCAGSARRSNPLGARRARPPVHHWRDSVRSPGPRASPATSASSTPTAPAPSSRRARRRRDRTPQAARDREAGFRSATRSWRGCRARRAVPSSSSAAGTTKPPPRASSAKKSSRGAVLALTPPNPASGARETQHCARPAQNGTLRDSKSATGTNPRKQRHGQEARVGTAMDACSSAESRRDFGTGADDRVSSGANILTPELGDARLQA